MKFTAINTRSTGKLDLWEWRTLGFKYCNMDEQISICFYALHFTPLQ